MKRNSSARTPDSTVLVEDEIRNAARLLAKKSLNIMLNAQESKAKRAIAGLLSGWRKKNGRRVKSGRQHRLFQTVVATTWRIMFRAAHALISHYFFTGCVDDSASGSGWADDGGYPRKTTRQANPRFPSTMSRCREDDRRNGAVKYAGLLFFPSRDLSR